MKSPLPSSLALAALFLAACHVPGLSKGEPELEPQTLVFDVFGMTSPESSTRVEAALESVDGVDSATVDYAARTVEVHCRAPLPPAALVAALRKQGFGAAAR